jgi:hypothetical protein
MNSSLGFDKLALKYHFESGCSGVFCRAADTAHTGIGSGAAFFCSN